MASQRPPPSQQPTSAPSAVASLDLASEIFVGVLHAVILVGALTAGLGSAFAPVVARLALPRVAVGNIPILLSAYAIAVPFFALNGIAEAFATGAAGPARVKEASLHLIGVTVLGAAAVAFFVPRYGALALITINAATLALRAASALSFTAVLLASRGLGGASRFLRSLPRMTTAATLVALAVAAHASVKILTQDIAQVAAATILGATALAVVWVFEGRTLRETARVLRRGANK